MMLDFRNIQFHEKEPVYIQIVKYLKRAIYLGDVQNGETLPSRREIAAQLKINPNTAQKAFRLMEEEQLIQTPKNAASIIQYTQGTLQQIQKEMTDDMIRSFVAMAKQNRLTLEEVQEDIQRIWAEDDTKKQIE